MLIQSWVCWRIAKRFKDYEPIPVTFKSIMKWLNQYEKSNHKYLLSLLDKVIYRNKKETIESLKSLNKNILKQLFASGLELRNIIYMQFDHAASSSPVMANLLRDAERLEGRCLFLDSNNVRSIFDETSKMNEGAIIYIDDFIGSGIQFFRSRKRVSEYIVGNFSEFLLAPCICEEATTRLNEEGVGYVTDHIHLKAERPLHEECNLIEPEMKSKLLNLCSQIHPKTGLGFKNMATMVSLYRNSPNSMPLILRGSKKQTPYIGVIPRTTDLPPIE